MFSKESAAANLPGSSSLIGLTTKNSGSSSLQSLRNSGDDVFATLLRISKESSANQGAASGTTKPESAVRNADIPFPQVPLTNGDLRPGEKRFRQPISPSFHNPRGRLTKLFSAATEEIGLAESAVGSHGNPQWADLDQANQSINSSRSPISAGTSDILAISSFLNSAANRLPVKSPAQLNAVSRKLDGVPTDHVNRRSLTFPSRTPSFSLNSVESTSKKRKLDGNLNVEDSLNLSFMNTPSPRPTEVVRLETEIKKLQFERDSAAKLVETERLRTEEHLRQRRQEEEESNTKTAEMWSQAEKIIAENDRLKARIEKADLEAITTRKKYEEQISALKLEAIDKERHLDVALRETRMENLSLNDKLRSVTIERNTLMEENDLLRRRFSSADKLASEAHFLKAEVQTLKSQLQTKEGQLADLVKASSLLSNLPDEMRHYRELQVTVPLLQKDNQKLREKAALARANEDKILSLEENIKRLEDKQCRFYDLELENEQLRDRMAQWDSSDAIQTPNKKPKGIQTLIDKVAELETVRKNLGDELSRKTQTMSDVISEKDIMAGKLSELKANLDLSENFRSRLEQNLQEISSKLTTTQTERDTLRLIKETIDSSTTRRDPLTQSKIHDLEERANRTETLAADFELLYEKAAASEVELKTRLTDLQTRCDAEVARSQELSVELENLRKRESSAVASSSIRSEESSFLREMKGDFDPFATQVITFQSTPMEAAEKRYLEEAAKVMEENKLLKEKLTQVREAGSYPTDLTMRAEEFIQGPGEQLEELKKQLEKLKQQRQVDMNSFKKTSSNFRQTCKELLGWNVRLDSNKVVFRLADGSQNDNIVFEREDENKPWELRETEFASTHSAFVNEFLNSHQSPPGFFARIVLQALSERTLICPT